MPTNNPTAQFKRNLSTYRDLKQVFRDNLVWLSGRLTELDKANERIEVEFSGPSVYFHKKAIAAVSEGKFFSKKKQDRLSHLELIYAVLPSWGMHRMGDTSTKLIDFAPFVDSVEKIYGDLDALRQVYEGKTIADASDEDIEKIRNLMFDIHVSGSESYLVSSSKTLHHILPNLFPPIDRAYSLRFMRRKHSHFYSSDFQIPGNDPDKRLESEKKLAREFIIGLRVFVKDHMDSLQGHLKKGDFNTSVLKVFDNLIVSAIGPKSEKRSKS